MHEYSIRGLPRERYIFYIALAAVGITAVAKQTAGYYGVVISITTFSVFAAAYFAFDRWVWGWPIINSMLGVPNIAGDWKVSGETDGADGSSRQWSGAVTINQTWSRIAISIDTETSRSRSGVASVERDPGHGYRLVYGYTNNPKGTDTELRSHRGTCEVILADDLQTAEATYFNDHQRRTCGTMVWTRKTEEQRGNG